MAKLRASWLLGLSSIALACNPDPRSTRLPGADQAKSCNDFELDLQRVWSKQTRAEVEAGIIGVDPQSGKTVAERVVARMDAATRDWTLMQQRVCLDTVVNETMPPEVHTKISACLLTNLAQQGQIVRIASNPTLAQVDLLESMIAEVGNDAANCLETFVYSFYDDDPQARVAREAIAEASVLGRFGDLVGASEALARGSEIVAHTQSDAVKVEFGLEAGWLAYDGADYDEAKRHSDQAAALASKIQYEVGLADALLLGQTIAQTQGDNETSAKLLRQALALYERSWGAEHFRSTFVRILLGDLLFETGQYDEALAVYQQSHVVLERTLGADSLDVAHSYGRLAQARFQLGDLVSAGDLYYKARGIVIATLGPNSTELASIDGALATLLVRQGKVEPALELAMNALAISERVHGPNHLTTAEVQLSLAEVLLRAGRHDDALLHANAALAVYSNFGGGLNQATVNTWHLIGSIYTEKPDHSLAIESYQQALAIGDRILGPNHPSAVVTLHAIGLEYAHQRDFVRALEYLLRAADTIQAQTPTRIADLAIIHNRIAEVYDAQGNLEKAVEHLRQAATGYEQAGIHENAGAMYRAIGNYHYKRNEHDAMLDAYVKAEALLTLVPGTDNAQLTHLRDWIVALCNGRKHAACSK